MEMTHPDLDEAVGGAWFSITPTEARIPVIAHAPHAGEIIPEIDRDRILLNDEQLSAELLASTDHTTDAFGAVAVGLGGTVISTVISRLVVDVERFADDEAEPQAQVGRGAVYTRTVEGAPLRRPDAAGRDRLLSVYFEPYHAAFVELVERTLRLHGRCLIIDIHSYTSRPLPYELDPDVARPGVCIGTDPFHTSESLAATLEAAARASGVSTARDRPFAGTFVPLPHYRADPRVASVMIELRRDLYMNETTGNPHAGFDRTKDLVSTLIEAAVAAQT